MHERTTRGNQRVLLDFIEIGGGRADSTHDSALLLPEPVRHGGHLRDTIPLSGSIAFLSEKRRQFVNQFAGIGLYGLVSHAVLGGISAMFTRLHGWTRAQVGLRYGIVFLLCGGGALFGGWLAGRLARRGVASYNLRVAAIGVTALIPFGIAAPLVADGWLALALLVPSPFASRCRQALRSRRYRSSRQTHCADRSRRFTTSLLA